MTRTFKHFYNFQSRSSNLHRRIAHIFEVMNLFILNCLKFFLYILLNLRSFSLSAKPTKDTTFFCNQILQFSTEILKPHRKLLTFWSPALIKFCNFLAKIAKIYQSQYLIYEINSFNFQHQMNEI